jgi:pyruvate,water dikinase
MSYIEWLHLGRLPREHVGGKGASLSELMSGGFLVPAGFCITADGYRYFAESAGIDRQVEAALAGADLSNHAAVAAAAERVSSLVAAAPLPDDLREQIAEAYDALVSSMGGPASAVRSSAVSEDGAAASFAGLYETYLNVRGVTSVLDSVGRCYASLWSERAVRYRSSRSVGGPDEAMAVVVMGMVESETSGIAFTAHPVTGDRNQVVINAAWGLGEAVVAGKVTPDSFVVHKPTGKLVEREIYPKEIEITLHPDGGGTQERKLPSDRAKAPSLNDDEVREVARIASQVEDHYGAPQDIEWGMAGGRIFVLQSRPITTL